ncbi:hypothetical protein [Kordiimonas sp.]|uniref:hypothetical protein n=1 Tax=Kordiimonas sp. TaxID=1970157 RepID=UPI003A91572A
MALSLIVDSITFESDADIYYARIPNFGQNGVTYLRSPTEAARHHFNPPQVRPAFGHPHWVRPDYLATHPKVSWPAVFVRNGAPMVEAVFFAKDGNTKLNQQLNMKAVWANGNDATDEVAVNFVNGIGTGLFAMENLPNTVQVMDGVSLRWQVEQGNGNFATEDTSGPHSFFITYDFPQFGTDFYFETYDWACRWAAGAGTPNQVLAGIWGEFSPVQQQHASGLVYWKNHHSKVAPAQDVPTAIQYQDHGLNERRASSCIVFDRLFMDCLGVHGIPSYEIMLEADQNFFINGGNLCMATGWEATTVVAHGNANAPDHWGSHWVTLLPMANGNYYLYDPSYGLAAYDCGNDPANTGSPLAVGDTIDIPTGYEVAAVVAFDCLEVTNLAPLTTAATQVASGSPNQPKLKGTVLRRV